MVKRKGLLGSALVCASVFGLFCSAPQAAAGGLNGLQVKATVVSEFKYDTNIFKKSSTQINRYDSNNTDDVTSGRFANMESMSDFIISPAFKLVLKTKGLGGKTLSVKPSVTYNLYTQNTEKNFAQFGLDVKQNLGSKSFVGVQVDYAPSVFGKNYLSDAVDNNIADGSITANERIYKGATYDKFSIAGTAGVRLWKAKKGGNGKLGALGVNSVDAELLLGFEKKEYEAPFSNRTEDGVMIGASVDMLVDKTTNISLSYLFESIETPVSTEVLIRNETDFGVDLNADADALDLDVRTEQNVDRSRTEHTFALKAETGIGNGWNGFFKYDLRLQNYSSNETYDITRRDRDDVRHRIGIGADKNLDDNWSLGFGWRWTQEDAGRSALAATDKVETKSYSKHELSATVAYNF